MRVRFSSRPAVAAKSKSISYHHKVPDEILVGLNEVFLIKVYHGFGSSILTTVIKHHTIVLSSHRIAAIFVLQEVAKMDRAHNLGVLFETLPLNTIADH